MHEDVKAILVTEEAIAARVRELGEQISKDYAGKEPVMVALLKGAAWFAVDLSRAIDLPLRMDFMVASSYGNSATTSGNVKVKLDLSENIRGKDVLLVDDIIDSGLTFAAITQMLKTQKPSSIRTVALCDKGERRQNDFKCDYVGFSVPDEFLVGYGLDYAGDYRNLPYIGILKPSVYGRA